MTSTRWTLLATLIGLAASLWFWNWLPRPYDRPPARTQVEQVAVDRATYKIGRHTVIDGEREIVIRLEDGRIRKIRRS